MEKTDKMGMILEGLKEKRVVEAKPNPRLWFVEYTIRADKDPETVTNRSIVDIRGYKHLKSGKFPWIKVIKATEISRDEVEKYTKLEYDSLTNNKKPVKTWADVQYELAYESIEDEKGKTE